MFKISRKKTESRVQLELFAVETEISANYEIDCEGSFYTVQVKLVKKPLRFEMHAKKITESETWLKRKE